MNEILATDPKPVIEQSSSAAEGRPDVGGFDADFEENLRRYRRAIRAQEGSRPILLPVRGALAGT